MATGDSLVKAELGHAMSRIADLERQVKQLEDSRFALAVAHTEDVLTIERLTFEEKSWQRDGSNAPEEGR